MRVTVCCFFTDVGADILDLAETMITSNGLQYEPVRDAHPYTHTPPVFGSFLSFSCFKKQKILSSL